VTPTIDSPPCRGRGDNAPTEKSRPPDESLVTAPQSHERRPRVRTETQPGVGAIAELFTDVLELCEEAGLVEVGVIALDGTKIRANASRGANRTYEKLVADILNEAEETDR
jgi:hypothetical protein